MSHTDATIDTDSLLLIVVGAHPKAELTDRPVAYALRQRMVDWLSERFADANAPLTPLVISDVWYLNDSSLRRCPTVSIGGPGVNALSAFLGDKLPSAFCVDEQLMVQMDLDLNDLIACCWGVDAHATGSATSAFADRYLDEFMEAAARTRTA